MQPDSRNAPLIGFGEVRHTRLKPRRHAFAYPTYFLMLPMRSIRAGVKSPLKINEFGALSFHDVDHGDGRSAHEGGSLGWLEWLLATEGIADADGEVWLHCYPRVLGYTFKPVSFWYCHRKDGSLRAIVVEVNNTFGERHCYLLTNPEGSLAWGAELTATKVFHVSPFCNVEGSYRFRFLRAERNDGERTVVRIEHDDSTGPVIQTSVSGTMQLITPSSIRHALLHYPAMTWGVIARIHWQAVQLWIKRVKFFRKPTAPDNFVTR